MPPPPLRPYQVEPARAILRSVRRGLGITFTVEMSRQAGKNELSAQIELLLLTLHGARGGSGVKAAPTWRPQAITSLRRLRDRLRDSRIPYSTSFGYIVQVGAASWAFLGAGEQSNIVGNTASLLLECDEAQDVIPEKWDKDLSPMAASTNATRVLYGTAWSDSDLLERTRQECHEADQRDGTRRNFLYDWQAVGAHNPRYLNYVQGERDRLGETHPLFQTQYELKTLAQRARMFSLPQLDLMRGSFPLQSEPGPADSLTVAAIDVAGAAEAPDEDLATPQGRDSTTLAIGSLRDGRLDLIAAYSWTDIPHHQTRPQVLALARHWRLRHILVDATGAGEPYAQDLARTVGRSVTSYTFTGPSKSELAYGLLARVNRGEIRIATGVPADLWDQLRLARTRVRPNRLMNFYVDQREGHDDWLMAVALLSHAADSVPAPRVASGAVRNG